MGQKCNPTGLRLGINRTWDSRWYAGKKDFGRLLQEDIKIREHLSERLKQAGVSRIVIERAAKKTRAAERSSDSRRPWYIWTIWPQMSSSETWPRR